MKLRSISTTQIDFIPGLPPSQPLDDHLVTDGQAIEGIGDKTNIVVKNSMPLVRIYPGIPSFTKGVSLFTRKNYFKSEGNSTKYLSYSDLLEYHGFTLSPNFHKRYLTLAYLADSFPTDSFVNDYGENFLQGLTDIASTGASSIAQMFGARTIGEALNKVTNTAKKQGGLFAEAAEKAKKSQSTATEFLNSLPIAGATNMVSALASGSRLDFPMVWKSSNFQPSYTMTIRLYNPNPASKEATRKYIAGPIAAIMLLGIPISADDSGSTYSWPFIHRIWSPGIYDLDPAYIANITIIKGGDQQQIAYSQRLGIVDVRIDFGSLYSSILASKINPHTRPTLQKYLASISGEDACKSGIQNFSTRGNTKEEILANNIKENLALAKHVATTTKKNIINTSSKMMQSAINEITSLAKHGISNQKLPSLKTIKNTTRSILKETKREAAKVIELTTEEINNPNQRVIPKLKEIANELEQEIPNGLKN